MHVFWSPLERWTLVRQDEKGSRRSCVFTWCCVTPKWFPCYCFNHQLLLKCQPRCDFVFHVCNDALPPGIQPGFGKSQELVTPCRTPARSDCALLFFPWDESFEYSVILFASGWDCGLRKWDNEEGWKKKKKNVEGKDCLCSRLQPGVKAKLMYCLDGNSSIAILIVLVYFVFESPGIFDTRWSWWQVTTALLLFCCSLSAARRRQK